MSSISVSKPRDSRTVVAEVKNLGLVFQMNSVRPTTLRDQFIKIFYNPGSLIKNQQEHLVILKRISIELYRGDRIGLLGVNGTGKTTLCRCMANIYKPTSGYVKTPDDTRAIFNTAIGIFPELTGRENAEIIYEFLFPNLGREKQSIIKEALEFSELEGFLDVPYKFYSNGMQARLCLALISARPSELLILDEVFDGADQFFRKKISDRVKSMIARSGVVVFVSHSTEQILEICNRVIVLNSGQVVFDGDPKTGIEFYSNMQ